jgi:protein-disulfide isomerase
MMRSTFLVALAAGILLCAQPGYSQSSDELKAIKEEIKALKEGQKNLQKELMEIKSLLLRARRAPPEFKEAVISIDGDPFKGDKNAKLALIEFSDYQWPFCGRHVRETLPQIEKEYILTGKVKYIFKDLPLESIHKSAFKLAEAARCAGEQGKYWEMHDRLFADKKAAALEDLPLYARELGLDTEAFQQCLDSGKYAPEIRRNAGVAKEVGIRSTPTFLLGFTQPDGKVKAVKMILGAQPYAAFKSAIESLLVIKE